MPTHGFSLKILLLIKDNFFTFLISFPDCDASLGLVCSPARKCICREEIDVRKWEYGNCVTYSGLGLEHHRKENATTESTGSHKKSKKKKGGKGGDSS